MYAMWSTSEVEKSAMASLFDADSEGWCNARMRCTIVGISLTSTSLTTSSNSACERGQGYVYLTPRATVLAPVLPGSAFPLESPMTSLTNSSSSPSAGSCSLSSSDSDSDPEPDSSPSDMSLKSASMSEPLAIKSSSSAKSSSSGCTAFSSFAGFCWAREEVKPNSAPSSAISSSSTNWPGLPASKAFCTTGLGSSSGSSSETSSPFMRLARFSSSFRRRSASAAAFSSSVFVRSEGFARVSCAYWRMRTSYSLSACTRSMLSISNWRSGLMPAAPAFASAF